MSKLVFKDPEMEKWTAAVWCVEVVQELCELRVETSSALA